MNHEPRLRPVDLARLSGLSTQQIRNYEDAGVLPPAARTESGYRVFGDAHRRALLTYRALQAGYGPLAATAVMRAVHGGDVPGALALVDEAHAGMHEQRTALRATREALEALAGRRPPPQPTPPTPGTADLRIGEVAALLGVRTSALRVWESAGLLTPPRERGTRYRQFGPDDIRDARLIHTLRRSHYLLDQIRPVLDELRREGSTEALRAAVATRGEALAGRTRAMLTGAGRLAEYIEYVEQGTADSN
ncbi:MerR family transcriptional regulator [Streptomyces geranii]|uniref:MerR family transcriptional regulator n=1 Tax=Streptomyces geranii TaxID=2058923 RepID=UPI000D034131|nr:MerR family transcriptional regulator [Streptomyces geranii]